MAFNIFKKKEEKFPAEEKAEVLGQGEEGLPPLPEEGLEELPPLPEEGEELPPLPEEGLPELEEKTEEELELPPLPEELTKPIEPTTESAKQFKAGFRSPEELKPPAVKPKEIPKPAVELPKQPEIQRPVQFGEVTAALRPAQPPHIYIKISKYRDVINAVQDLHTKIIQTKQELEDLHSLGKEEEEKLKETAEVVLKIEELLTKLESTFSAPEE